MAKKRSPSIGFRVLVTTALVVVIAVTGINAEDKKYSDTYDNLDVDAILKDDVERDKYYTCFMDTGPCHTEAAMFFKSRAPEAIMTSCKYCTKKQMDMFEKIVSWFADNRPKEWNILIEKTIKDAKKRGLKI